jgi:hypothetical protein
MTVVLLALVRLDAGHIDAKDVACPFRLVERPEVVAGRRASPFSGPSPTRTPIAGLRSVIDSGLADTGNAMDKRALSRTAKARTTGPVAERCFCPGTNPAVAW